MLDLYFITPISCTFAEICVCYVVSVSASTSQPTEQVGVQWYWTRASICWLHICPRHSAPCCNQLHWL